MRIFAIVLIVLCLFACERTLPGSPDKTAIGVVISKIYTASYSRVVEDNTTIDMGDGMLITIPGTRTVYYPAQFTIWAEFQDSTGEKKKGSFPVAEDLYNSVELQDEVNLSAEDGVSKSQ